MPTLLHIASLLALAHAAQSLLSTRAQPGSDWPSALGACAWELLGCAVLAVIALNNFLSYWAANALSVGSVKGEWDFGVRGGCGGKEVVLVTGGSSGIGREVVSQLLGRVGSGVKVVVLDRAGESAHEAENVFHWQCDVSSRSEVMRVAKEIVDRVGHPTVLINNAGVVRARSVLDSSQEDIDATFDVNCKAHYWTTQAFAGEMIEANKGHIITISSSTAYATAPLGVAYAASKSAALSFHEGLTAELRYVHKAPRVRTSVVCPGHVETGMFEGFVPGKLPSWVAPSLRTEDVAGSVVECVLGGKSRHLIAPAYSNLLPALRALPAWVYHLALYLASDSLRDVAAIARERERPRAGAGAGEQSSQR